MKQKKFKLAILFFPAVFAYSFFIFVTFVLGFLISPEVSFAANVGEACTIGGNDCQSPYTCPAGTCIDPNAVELPPPILGLPKSVSNLCPAGQGVEVDPTTGLCLPVSQFKTGLANSKSLAGLIAQVVNILLTLAGIIAVVLLVIGGFQYMTSAGNEELAEKGKKTIINATIGLVVVVLAYALVTILVDLITKPH